MRYLTNRDALLICLYVLLFQVWTHWIWRLQRRYVRVENTHKIAEASVNILGKYVQWHMHTNFATLKIITLQSCFTRFCMNQRVNPTFITVSTTVHGTERHGTERNGTGYVSTDILEVSVMLWFYPFWFVKLKKVTVVERDIRKLEYSQIYFICKKGAFYTFLIEFPLGPVSPVSFCPSSSAYKLWSIS